MLSAEVMMPQEPEYDETYRALTQWADAVRCGDGSVEPPADRAVAPRRIFDTWRAVGESDPRLARIAADADKTGYAPWAWDDGVRSPIKLLSKRNAWIAIAACVPLVIGVWSFSVLQGGAPPLGLSIGYSDFGHRVRGTDPLRGGSQATMYVTTTEGFYSILVLGADRTWTVDQANVSITAARHEIPWRLPVVDARVEETLVVVVGDDPWTEIESDVSELTRMLVGVQSDQVADQMLAAIRTRGFRAESVTYTVVP